MRASEAKSLRKESFSLPVGRNAGPGVSALDIRLAITRLAKIKSETKPTVGAYGPKSTQWRVLLTGKQDPRPAPGEVYRLELSRRLER